MGYRIQPAQDNTITDRPLGVEINFNVPGVFKPVYSTDRQALQNLKNLLLTRIGERYDKPTYGTNLLNVIFEPSVPELKAEIIDIITVPVNYWLPEISLERIDIVTAQDDATLDHDIKITITFSVNSDQLYNITINANEETGQLSVE